MEVNIDFVLVVGKRCKLSNVKTKVKGTTVLPVKCCVNKDEDRVYVSGYTVNPSKS